MTALQKTIITATIAVLTGAGIYEARQASQLRNQVQTLQQQQAPLVEQIQQMQREQNEMTNRMASAHKDDEQLNRNTTELLRLRGEISLLRGQNQELQRVRADYRKLLANVAATPELAVESKDSIRRESWSFAGYATPEATLQSVMYAREKADATSYLACLAPNLKQKIKDQWTRKNESEITMTLGTQNPITGIQLMTGYRILNQKVLSNGSAILRVRFEGENLDQELQFQKIGNEWKYAGGVGTQQE